MTHGETHVELAALSDMLYQAEQTRMHHVIAREAELRRDLRRLDATRVPDPDLPAHTKQMLQLTGADVQWLAWVGRKRAELNRHLALILAQKEHLLTNLRRAYGRKIAADQIVNDDRKDTQHLQLQSEMQEEERLTMIQAFRCGTKEG